jgi:hypothetical protein
MVGAWSPVVWEASPLTTLVSDGIVPVAHSVSIPGGKPLHEPPKVFLHGAVIIDRVSIPGGKPLHEPLGYILEIISWMRCFNPRREAPPRATSLPTSLWSYPQGFNPRREAPPRATKFMSMLSKDIPKVSIPGGKPLHEPPAGLCVEILRFPGFNPRREAPPRATTTTLAKTVRAYKFQSQAGSPSTSHQKKFYQVRIW